MIRMNHIPNLGQKQISKYHNDLPSLFLLLTLKVHIKQQICALLVKLYVSYGK